MIFASLLYQLRYRTLRLVSTLALLHNVNVIFFLSRLEPVDVSRSEPAEDGIRHDCSGHLPSATVAQETIAEEEDEGNADEPEVSSRHDECTVKSSSSNDGTNAPALEQGSCNSETSLQHPRQPVAKVCVCICYISLPSGCYIQQKRSVLEWSRGSADGKA